ncbi:MAG: hypothetical protein ACTSYI_05155 [Promethearchaeota archaeon]
MVIGIIQLNFIYGSAQNTTITSDFTPGDVYLYKNEHYDLDALGNRFHNITKWTNLTIDEVDQSDSGLSTVTFTKFDAENVSLEELEEDPSLWVKHFSTPLNFGYFTLGVINQSEPLSRYQVLYNEKSASMKDVTSDILTEGQYQILYSNELSYFKTQTEIHSVDNEVIYHNLTGHILNQRERVLEATIDGDSNILLNGSTLASPKWYNISLDLKLYLVYGKESNILLSYNINFTIAEHYHETTSSLEIQERFQRKIIFWNIRKPDELTEDYPILEVLDLPNFNLETVTGISIASLTALLGGLFVKGRRK